MRKPGCLRACSMVARPPLRRGQRRHRPPSVRDRRGAEHRGVRPAHRTAPARRSRSVAPKLEERSLLTRAGYGRAAVRLDARGRKRRAARRPVRLHARASPLSRAGRGVVDTRVRGGAAVHARGLRLAVLRPWARGRAARHVLTEAPQIKQLPGALRRVTHDLWKAATVDLLAALLAARARRPHGGRGDARSALGRAVGQAGVGGKRPAVSGGGGGGGRRGGSVRWWRDRAAVCSVGDAGCATARGEGRRERGGEGDGERVASLHGLARTATSEPRARQRDRR